MHVTPADLLIVTVTHNSAALLEPFSAALRTAPRADHLFVDNASSDGSADAVRRLFPHATLLENRRNTGTAAAWNEGMARAALSGKSLVWILNPDVLVHPGCMEALLAFLSAHPRAGAAGPVLLFSHRPGVIESFGARFDMKRGTGGQQHQGESLDHGLPEVVDADYVDGGSCMLRLPAMEEAGAFDQDLFMYGEEADLCHRLRQSGWTVHAVRKAVVSHRHYELAGSELPGPAQLYYMTRNHIRLAHKHHGRAGFAAAAFQELVTGLRQLPRWRREGARGVPGAWLGGWFDGLRGKSGPMSTPKRGA